jgi:hypothetical protein
MTGALCVSSCFARGLTWRRKVTKTTPLCRAPPSVWGDCGWRHQHGLTGELLAELARRDTADLVKLLGSPSRRHDRTWPAAADVSTVDTLPADTARRGEGRCRAVGPTLLGGESAGAEMGQQRLSDQPEAPSSFPRYHAQPKPLGSHWSR